ncbi:MAG: hypothetical protein JEY99_09490 [Spirochaetales bacterium]|nr:hypothetical protein [Spirochaetales bacterium]
MQAQRIRIISGHFGSGKTEFSVNYALFLRNQYDSVGLADLDVVNPYFRSRERFALFAEKGVRLVGSQHGSLAVDTPSVSAEVNTLIENESIQTVLDTGGDPGGVRLLARFASKIEPYGYDMFLVVNANRPETQSCDQVLTMIENIEGVSGMKISSLINNTHLLKSTTTDDIIRGAELVRQVSATTGIKIRYHSIPEWLLAEMPEGFNKNFEGTIFPLRLYMRDEWMS